MTDQYLETMRHARNSDAVVKLELIDLRGDIPTGTILVFEGDDDKIVYFQWIRRIDSSFVYEPLPVRGKKRVLQLRDAALRDLNGLANNVYFFVDRDYDDLGGHSEHENTFVTDAYSVENYLVSTEVLRDFLTNEFHCHGRPSVKAAIIEVFDRVHAQFIEVTSEQNFRIFAGRRLNIRIEPIPEKLNAVAKVNLVSVEAKNNPENIIRLEREPTAEECADLRIEFDGFDCKLRFRGKFMIKFFERWLLELAKDYSSEETVFFHELDRVSNAKVSEITLGTMASRSRMPSGLEQFVQSMVEEQSKHRGTVGA